MRKSTAMFSGIVLLSLISAGCYNNPHTSERFPGSGPQDYMSRPSVGPGTVAGGSTAGPQPPKPELGGHVQPMPAGGVPAEPGLEHAAPPRPEVNPGLATPQGPASRMGNEKGGDGRGPGLHSEPQKH